MADLAKLFIDMKKYKMSYLKAKKGEDLEDLIENKLKRFGFNRVIKENDSILNAYIKNNKERFLNPLATKIYKNELAQKGKEYIDFFIKEPYGGQNFPDFMVFTENYIVFIETKYSEDKSTKPMWNSNLPKANSFYIFGSYGKEDLTFFKGSEVLPHKERIELVNFFEKTKEIQNSFETKIENDFLKKKIAMDRGFTVYVRKAFEQKKTINSNAYVNYFVHPNREKVEEKCIRLTRFLK